MALSNSMKQTITNLTTSISNIIDRKISDHDTHASSTNFGHVKAGGAPQSIGISSNAGTDNGYYARADHVHTASFNNLTDKPTIDNQLSASSTNAVENKAVYDALYTVNEKMSIGDFAQSSSDSTVTLSKTSVSNNHGRRHHDLLYTTENDICISCLMKQTSVDRWYTGGLAVCTEEPASETTMVNSNGGSVLICAGSGDTTNSQSSTRTPLRGVSGLSNTNIEFDKWYQFTVYKINNTFTSTIIDTTTNEVVLYQSRVINNARNYKYWTFHTYEGCTISYSNVNIRELSFGSGIIDMIYPIGSIYLSANNISPETLFNGTKWQQIKDRFLLASGDTYTNGAIGGEASHTLTVNEIPSHNHSTDIRIHQNNGGNKNMNRTTWSSSGDSGGQFSTHNAGGGQSHNNMPPFVVVYIWKRTA